MGIIERSHVQWSLLVPSIHPVVEIASLCAYCQQVAHDFKDCPFVDDKLKLLMKEELTTSLHPIVPNTLSTHVGVPMQQLWPQPGLVNSSTPISQQLGWQQPITPLIARQPKVVPYPPYPIWYNILPSFVPMDLNM